jgi:hypothetical protein
MEPVTEATSRGFVHLRLDAILGKGRIRREDKAAKAEAAMVAVDELVDSLEADLKL